jgi:hypothetical protein
MPSALDQLVALQKLETELAGLESTLGELPARRAALDAEATARKAELEAAVSALNAHQTARRAIEKDLAVVQARLEKFKDQLMAVKTNKEYAAMQLEMATAEAQIKALEDQVLTNLLEADELSTAVGRAREALAGAETRARDEAAALTRRETELGERHRTLAAERDALKAQVPAAPRALFEMLLKQRRGLAVAEARAGHCTGCHVRLRPQIYNQLRNSDQIFQCDSCQRVLVYVGDAAAAEPPPDAGSLRG